MQPLAKETTVDATTALIERLKSFYADLSDMPMDQIHRIYDKDVLFKDPVHEIRGIDALHAYMNAMCSELTEGRFEFLDQHIGMSDAYIKWHMHFRHPKLRSGMITVRGVSHLQFSDRIYYHEDIYDMGEMLYEHLPMLGGVTRWLKRRLAAR